MTRARDDRTLDLFDIPRAPAPVEGALYVEPELRGLIARILKNSKLSRDLVADKMAELLGHPLSIHQINAWTAESREAWRFPVAYLPAFEAACETHALTEWIAAKRGCALLVGEDSLLAELGRLEKLEQDLKARKAALKKRMGRSEL